MGPGSHALSSDYPGICGKILSEEWGGEVFQLTGAAGNMDPVLGPRDAAYAEECGKSLASSLLGMTFTRVENKGLLRLVNEAIDLPYKADQITPELVRRHADSLVRTSSKVSASFGEDVRNWESEILDRFKSGPVPNRLRYNVHVVDLDGVLFFSAMVSRSASIRQKPENIFRTRLSSSPAIPMGRIHIFLRNGPTRCGKDMNTKPSRCTSISRLHILFQRNVRLFI